MTGAVKQFTRKFTAENAAASPGHAEGCCRALNKARRAHPERLQNGAPPGELDAKLQDTLDAYRDYVNSVHPARGLPRVEHLRFPQSRMPQAVTDTADQFLEQVQQLTETLAQGSALDCDDRRRPPLPPLIGKEAG